jgi:hypothetical protein
VIPLICHVATLKPQENTLCLVKDVKMIQTLEGMVGYLCGLNQPFLTWILKIEEMIPKPVYTLVPKGSKGLKRAAGEACKSSEGCLVFCSVFSTPLPECIRYKSFNSVIHVGWTGDEDLCTC